MASRARSSTPPGPVGVVVVEPFPVVRAGLALLVDAWPGCRLVATAGTPREALEAMARTRRHRIAVLVSLATRDGAEDAYELIRELRERHPSAGVLAMGADADAATISRALFVGADGYVDKRSSPEGFCDAFASAADHLMVLIGPPEEALGQVAEALVQRRDVEGRLTAREREVLAVAAEGHTAREIADRLGVRERTVTTHLARIYQKLGVRTRVAAVRIAARTGLVATDLRE